MIIIKKIIDLIELAILIVKLWSPRVQCVSDSLHTPMIPITNQRWSHSPAPDWEQWEAEQKQNTDCNIISIITSLHPSSFLHHGSSFLLPITAKYLFSISPRLVIVAG